MLLVPRETYRILSMAPSVSCDGLVIDIFETPMGETVTSNHSQGCIDNNYNTLRTLVSLFTYFDRYFDKILLCLPLFCWCLVPSVLFCL